MPVPEDEWTDQDVSLRFETLQAQIQRMAVSIDGITAQVHPNMEELKSQIEFLEIQIKQLAGKPSHNKRWDWRKLQLEKFTGNKSEWRSFAFSVKQFIRRESPPMEMLMKDTECTGTAILNGRLREHGITAEDDAEMYCLLNSYTTGTAQEFVQLKEGQNAIEVWRQMCHEYDPKTGVSGVQAMGEIIGPTRSKHNADFRLGIVVFGV